MKITAYVDNLIPQDELEEVIQKFNDLYAPLSPSWEIIREDMSHLEWADYGNGLTISKEYLKKKIANQHTLIWVAHEHYLPARDNIWGWNFSNLIRGQHVHQCRFDTQSRWRKSRIINTFGTLVHEIAHSHDAQIYNRLGVRLHKVLGVDDYDTYFVHGKSIRYQYIGRDEDINAGTIKETIMPLLAKAYEPETKETLIKQAIRIAREIITILKKKDYE